MASVLGEVPVASHRVHLESQGFDLVLVSEALDFLCGSAVLVVDIRGAVHLARHVALQLEPVGDRTYHAEREKEALKDGFRATSEHRHTSAHTYQAHSNLMIDEHRS